MEVLGLIIVVVALIAVGSAIGLTIEWRRGSDLRAFAREQHGTYEPGGILSGAPVPEGAPFDGGRFLLTAEGFSSGGRRPQDEPTYNKVLRVPGDEASYVIAHYSRRSDEASGVVCFVSLARADVPEVDVLLDLPKEGREELVAQAGPGALQLPDAVPGFGERVTVLAAPGTAAPEPRALERLFGQGVQSELLARADVLSGFQVRGNVVRVQARRRQLDQVAHREIFEIARRLASEWASATRW